MGRYFCLVKGDWEAGLPHLAQGDDPALRALAEDDLKQTPPVWKPAAGVAPPAQVPAAAAMKLADAWWDLAQKAHDQERDCMLVRAGYWYEEVAAGPEAGQYSTKLDLRRQALAKQGIEVPPARVVMNSIGMPLVLIPPGEFEMGATPEEIQWALAEGKHKSKLVLTEAPWRAVKISKPFYLATYHVTQAEYERVMGVNPSAFTEKQMDMSVFKPPLAKSKFSITP